jgi:hypothetical protein
MIQEYHCPKLVRISKTFEELWWDDKAALTMKICPFYFAEFFIPLALLISCYEYLLALLCHVESHSRSS